MILFSLPQKEKKQQITIATEDAIKTNVRKIKIVVMALAFQQRLEINEMWKEVKIKEK